MTGRLLLSMAAVLLVAPAVSAQQQSEPALGVELVVTDAIAEALTANPELIALRHEFEAMSVLPAQEAHLMPPMFETQIWGWPVTTLNPARTDMYMFMGEQALQGRGKRASRVLVAERDAEVSRQRIAVRASEILNELKQAYVDLALARETAAIYGREAPLLRDLAEAATLRYAAGQSGQHHTVAALLELTRLETDRIQSLERAALAEARLNAVMGRPQDRPIGPLRPLTSSTNGVSKIEQLAPERHPQVTMANAAIGREEAELARLRNDRRPDFMIGGGYMLMPGAAGAWTARAGITWPNAPWSRGRLSAAIDAQEKRVAAATAQRDVLTSTIRHAVRSAAIRLAAAQQRAQLIESTVLPHIEHVFELARTAYANGDGEFAEVLEARRLQLSTEIERQSALADVERALADLATAGGMQ